MPNRGTPFACWWDDPLVVAIAPKLGDSRLTAWRRNIAVVLVGVAIGCGSWSPAACLVVGAIAVTIAPTTGLRVTVGLAAVASPWLPWPAPALLAVAGWYAVWLLQKSPRPNRTSHRVRVSQVIVSCSVGLAAGAIAALIASNRLIGEPIVLQLQKPALEFIVAAVIGLSALNAVAEELLWRVALFSETDTRLAIPVASQAISFGAAHWAGIPYGWSGVILAGVFSVALVMIKSRWGLSATLLAHFGADLVIFSAVGWTVIFAPG